MNSTLCLTDDQIDDALIGDLAVECAEHLAGCEHCQARLIEAEAPIAAFNQVSLAWGERQSATLPTRSLTTTQSGWLPKAAWAATAAAVVAVGIAVPIAHHRGDATTAVATNHVAATPTMMASTGAVDSPVAAREEQIAQDNQMLGDINRELSSSSSASAQTYGLQPADQLVSQPVSAHVPRAIRN